MAVYRKRSQTARSSVKRRPTVEKRKGRVVAMKQRRAASFGRITGLGSDFGFPDRLRTKLKYADVIALTSTTGQVADWAFRMNSVHDPDYTSTGHQPMWFDQIAAAYGNYRVLSSRIIATFMPTEVTSTETGDSGPFIVGITTNNSTALNASTAGTLLENNNTVSDCLVDKQGGNNSKTLTHTFSIARDLGVGTGDDTAAARVDTNPSAIFYAHVWGKDIDETSNTRLVVKVEIEFNVEFFRRVEGTPS